MNKAYDPDPDFDLWVAEALAVPVLDVARQLGFTPMSGGKVLSNTSTGEYVGRCPRCGGTDRFSVKPMGGLWYCRGASRGGYDGVSLARYLRDLTFIEAVELVSGKPKPGRPAELPEDRRARLNRAEAELGRVKAEVAAREQKQEQEAASFRERERKRCHEIWRRAASARGTLVELYLKHRALELPVSARLRIAPSHPLHHPPGSGGAVVHTGPAMLAAIVGNPDAEGQPRFIGLHQTWIDSQLATPKGKFELMVEGEAVASKRSRGRTSGGHLLLVDCPDPERLVIGEGIETVLSVWLALCEAGADLQHTAFWTSIDLKNLGGPAAGSMKHPTRRVPDKNGRLYAPTIPNAVPDMSEPDRAIQIPASVREVLILADGDSDRVLVENTVTRAATRWARPGLVVKVAWPDDGSDFNAMRMAAKVRAA